MNKWIDGKIGDEFNDVDGNKFQINSHHFCANCLKPIVLVSKSTNDLPEHPCSDMFPIILPKRKLWNILGFLTFFMSGLVFFTGMLGCSFLIGTKMINSIGGFIFYVLFVLFLSSIPYKISEKCLDLEASKTIHIWSGKSIIKRKLMDTMETGRKIMEL